MIDVPLMHKLIQALPERAHLLIVGDVDQLPSVGPGSALADIIRSEVEPVVERFGWQLRLRDKVIQTENNYDKAVFNGDIGQVVSIDPEERELVIRFEERDVLYDFNELDELSLAYAITIHKSQGSEFPAVVVPLAMQHYLLLQRNLVYTAMTRGRRLVVLVGQRKALAIAARNDRAPERFSCLYDRLVRSQIDPSGRSYSN